MRYVACAVDERRRFSPAEDFIEKEGQMRKPVIAAACAILVSGSSLMAAGVQKPDQHAHQHLAAQKPVSAAQKAPRVAQKPVQKVAQKPIQKPVQKVVQKPIQKPIQKVAQKPVQKPVQKPGYKAA